MEPPSLLDNFKILTASSAIHFPDCCSSLSVSLIKQLASLLPPNPALTLSIGSGSGLLEALLLRQRPTLDLKAVEVPTTKNKYMPVDRIEIVNGYRDLCNLAADASAWMFIYPRDPWLIQKYVQHFGDRKCELIIWIGPKADIPKIENDFLGQMWIKEDYEDRGLKDYEVMVLWRRDPLDEADSNAKEDDTSAIA